MASRGASVAILGAGPSGLAACKAALEEGLRPTVFERAGGVGGLWRRDAHGKTWRSLRTNLSKFTCAFSDAPWPGDAEVYPTGAAMQEYLERFAREHRLMEHMRFGCSITSARPARPSGWEVVWEPRDTGAVGDGASAGSSVFDYLIVATGIFARPKVDGLPGADRFPGRLLHTTDYREPTEFAGARVLVVGAAFSGVDVAADLVGHAASVTVATRRPHWYLPRFIGGRPGDLAFYSRASAEKGRATTEEERNHRRHAFFASIVGETPPPLIAPSAERGDLPFVAISDAFLGALRSGGLSVRCSEVTSLDGGVARFADGGEEEANAVILATGYRLELPFLDPCVLEAMEFESEDLLQPAILHECVWPAGLPGLAFVGIDRGPYFAAMELQARWACGVFSGRLPMPAPDEVVAGVDAERQIRQRRPRPQFPHGDYVEMADSLARRVGVHPAGLMAREEDPLRGLLYDGPLLPFHYRLCGFGAKRELAESAIRECNAMYPPPA